MKIQVERNIDISYKSVSDIIDILKENNIELKNTTFSTEESYSSVYPVLQYNTEETDEEYNKRQKHVYDSKEKQEAWEKKEYERLTKKFKSI